VEEDINVYPNPASDNIIFNIDHITGVTNIEIFDIMGKKVMEQKLPDNKQIQINNLPQGIYIFQIINNENKFTGRIIIR